MRAASPGPQTEKSADSHNQHPKETNMTTRKMPTGTTWTKTTSDTGTSRMASGTSGLAIAAPTTDTSVSRPQLLQSAAAVLASRTSIVGKSATRLIFNRDREGRIMSITTVTGLQSTTVTPAGRLVSRALGTKETQTVADEGSGRWA